MKSMDSKSNEPENGCLKAILNLRNPTVKLRRAAIDHIVSCESIICKGLKDDKKWISCTACQMYIGSDYRVDREAVDCANCGLTFCEGLNGGEGRTGCITSCDDCSKDFCEKCWYDHLKSCYICRVQGGCQNPCSACKNKIMEWRELRKSIESNKNGIVRGK